MNPSTYFLKFWHRLRITLLGGSRLPVVLGLLITLLVHLAFTAPPPLVGDLVERLDNVVYDQRINLVKGTLRSNEHNIVIVDFDQASIDREGQWPWSRFKIGELVKRLSEYGVLVIGFDVFFPEYERNLLSELQSRVELEPDYQNIAGELLPQLEDFRELLNGDRYFADSMRNAEVVLGFAFRTQTDTSKGILPAPIFSISDADRDAITLDGQVGFEANVDILQNSASGGGFIDNIPDFDGIIRRTPLVMQHAGQVYPSLALDMARVYYFEENFTPFINTEGGVRAMEGINMGAVRIPTDTRGRVLVPFIGPTGSYPYLSASDVIRGTLNAAEQALLENSLVLVGTTATGLFDLRATPVQPVFPGVEIHANILNAILSSSPAAAISAGDIDSGSVGGILGTLDEAGRSPFPTRPYWESGVVDVAIFVIGIGLSLLYPVLGPLMLGLVSISLITGITLLNTMLWSRYNLDISLVIFWLLIVVLTILNLGYGYLRERFNKNLIKTMFDQYVPPAHIDEMLGNPDSYNFEGEFRDLSVLFCDIRNFTAISENYSAAELKQMLNNWFTPITSIIFSNNGTIDKYVGDMVMAFWGAPLRDNEHRHHAVRAALEILQKAELLQQEFAGRGWPALRVGIGINSGMMNVGDMGSTFRRAYTVLGDAVNLGSRLEELTKEYGTPLLIGENTHEGLDDTYLCRQVDRVKVRGRVLPVRIYQPLCLHSEATAELRILVRDFHRACESYLDRHWEDAKARFLDLKARDPSTRLYSFYLNRIDKLQQQELPEGWDGTVGQTLETGF